MYLSHLALARFLEHNVSQQNAHQPTHNPHFDLNFQLESDRTILDQVLRQKVHHRAICNMNVVSEGEEKTDEPLQRASAWVYPKLHQEIISGRPTDFMGGCGYRLEEASRSGRKNPVKLWEKHNCEAKPLESKKDAKDPVSGWVYPKQHQEIYDWRPQEWLVDHHLSMKAPAVRDGSPRLEHESLHRTPRTLSRSKDA